MPHPSEAKAILHPSPHPIDANHDALGKLLSTVINNRYVGAHQKCLFFVNIWQVFHVSLQFETSKTGEATTVQSVVVIPPLPTSSSAPPHPKSVLCTQSHVVPEMCRLLDLFGFATNTGFQIPEGFKLLCRHVNSIAHTERVAYNPVRIVRDGTDLTPELKVVFQGSRSIVLEGKELTVKLSFWDVIDAETKAHTALDPGACNQVRTMLFPALRHRA